MVQIVFIYLYSEGKVGGKSANGEESHLFCGNQLAQLPFRCPQEISAPEVFFVLYLLTLLNAGFKKGQTLHVML